jgi:nitroimidazol reductase NimA-like FMN-containing flavoprotein (pyridoxamine 5'-phosphate oxidase superfamily)
MPTKFTLSNSSLNRLQREEYAQNDQWIMDFLAHAQVGYVATKWDDQPFITPINYWYDDEKQEIYFHTNITGRLRANVERNDKACFTASKTGDLLPSNIALEFGIQYESVIVFGSIRILNDRLEKSAALYGLIEKYFPQHKPGQHYRPITEEELKRTAVYALTVESWSGKRNWKESADQSPDWKNIKGTQKLGSIKVKRTDPENQPENN